jgi:uncharacterized protein
LMETKLEIKEYEPSKISKPTLVVGVPEAGLVGIIASSYLRDQMKLPELGYIESDLLPAVVVVHESKPKHPIRIFGKDNLAVITSEVPLHPRLSLDLAKEIVSWAKSKNTKLILGITSVPFDEEIEGEAERKPKVLAISSDERPAEALKQIGANPFEEGVMMGTHAAILRNCITMHQPNLTLLAEAYSQFPDPGAAAAVIQVVNKVLSTNVDIQNLIKQSEEIRLRMRELMATTQENMRRNVTTGPSLYG